jgi:hypothetical protein
MNGPSVVCSGEGTSPEGILFLPQQDSALNTFIFLFSFLFLYRPSKEGVVAVNEHSSLRAL